MIYVSKIPPNFFLLLKAKQSNSLIKSSKCKYVQKCTKNIIMYQEVFQQIYIQLLWLLWIIFWLFSSSTIHGLMYVGLFQSFAFMYVDILVLIFFLYQYMYNFQRVYFCKNHKVLLSRSFPLSFGVTYSEPLFTLHFSVQDF